jgi:phosphotransferase system enzyme I (PtsI)
MRDEVWLEGCPVARGIAIGTPFILDEQEGKTREIHIAPDAIDTEIARYRKALASSRNDILRIKAQLGADGIKDGVSVLDAYLQIINDPLLNDEIEREIRRKKKNAEFIFHEAINRFRAQFRAMADPFFQSRFEDVEDISRRIKTYLRKETRLTLSEVPPGSIVLSRSLAPSEVAETKKSSVAAFVTEVGGATSHTAIIAKAKGIPYVANCNFSKIGSLATCKTIIVDALEGRVIIDPSESTLDEYSRRQKTIAEQERKLEAKKAHPAVTQDGVAIALRANVEIADDFSALVHFGAEGVGLFRSEYIVLERGAFPSEDEQYEIYKSLLEQACGHPVVIRAFDIGLDKVVSTIGQNRELNPALGLRAIRFLLQEKELFRVQIRAILRASPFGDVRILLPMISCLNELLEAKRVVEDARAALEREGVAIRKRVKIGCMIEVPSAAMIADLIADECDFLSIGTNDLTQYALAVDRTNQSMSALYTSAHPAVIRLIQKVVQAARKKRIPVSVCGEVASDPCFIPLLLGLGIRELSVSCRFLPIIKHVIGLINQAEAKVLVAKLMKLSMAQDIQEALSAEYARAVPLGTIDHL